MASQKSAIEQLRIETSQRPTANTNLPKWAAIIFCAGLLSAPAYYYVEHTTTSRNALPSSDSISVSPGSSPGSTSTSTSAPSQEQVAFSNDQATSDTSTSSEAILDASGHIVARRVATVSSRVTGKLEGLFIEEGQRVNRDQVLARVDNVQANLAYQRAQANLAASKANYQELNVLKVHEQRRLTRHQTLNQSQLVSEQLTEDTEMRIAQLSAQIAQASAHIQLQESNLALAKYELDQHQIRAPFDGVVISKNAQVGELISAGMSGGSIRTGVGTIVDMSSLEIEVEVSESYINRVKPKQKVTAKLDAYPQWEIPSEVIAVIPTADRQKASIKVRIKLLEVDHRVLPDMGVRVSFLSTSQDDGLYASNSKGE